MDVWPKIKISKMDIKRVFKGMEKYTVEEFQQNFDNLINLVENDKKSFIITSDHGDALIMPADDELIKIYTEHNEAP